MKTIVNIALVLGAVSLVVGIISRVTITPITITRGGGLEANAFLAFTNTCLLVAITFTLLQILNKK